MKEQATPNISPFNKRLLIDASVEEQLAADANIRRYLEVILRIHERLKREEKSTDPRDNTVPGDTVGTLNPQEA